MSTQEIRAEVHRLVDTADETILRQVRAILTGELPEPEVDILDELTEAQRARLEESLQQIAQGKTTPHAQVKEEIAQWLRRE